MIPHAIIQSLLSTRVHGQSRWYIEMVHRNGTSLPQPIALVLCCSVALAVLSYCQVTGESKPQDLRFCSSDHIPTPRTEHSVSIGPLSTTLSFCSMCCECDGLLLVHTSQLQLILNVPCRRGHAMANGHSRRGSGSYEQIAKAWHVLTMSPSKRVTDD